MMNRGAVRDATRHLVMKLQARDCCCMIVDVCIEVIMPVMVVT